MAGAPRRRLSGDVPVAVAAALVFVVFVIALTRSATTMVSGLELLSRGVPELYAALLALLVGLPGLLWTLPRAIVGARPAPQRRVRHRRQLADQRRGHLRTDVLGVALLLIAQVPLPAPWSAAGKAATIANITESAEIVEISEKFGVYSLVVFVVGAAAAALVKVYGHAAAYRVLGMILAIGAPVVSWFLAVRAIS